MGWKAYPFKDGLVIDGASLTSSSYASRLEGLAYRSMYWQNDEIGQPDVDLDEVKLMYQDFLARPCEGDYWPEIGQFLKFCMDNECGFVCCF